MPVERVVSLRAGTTDAASSLASIGIALLTVLSLAAPARAQLNASMCGPLTNGYGPYDYRSDRDRLPVVEGAHFTPEVEQLVKGNGGYLGGDLDYTLRAFPNHHRALISTARYGERTNSLKAPNMRYEVECYFVRAITFRTDDAVVRMLFARYLNKHKRKAEALEQLAAARRLAGDNPFTHYNLGLIYMEVGEPERALEQAHEAMALDFPRTELKSQLVAANKWREPPAAAASAASAASSANASAAAPASEVPVSK